MKICGFRKLDFLNKESGEQIEGFNLYQKVNISEGSGFYTEKYFINADIASAYDITSDVLLDVLENGKDILLDKVKNRVIGVFII